MGHMQKGGIISSLLKFILFMGLLALLTGAGGVYFAHQELHRASSLTDEKIIIVEPGMGTQSIAARLEQEGIIRSALFFRAVIRLRQLGGSLQAGEYAIPAGASMDDVITLLVEGRAILHRLTIPEGRTTRQVLALVNENDVLTGEITLTPKEGDLLPETYAFTRAEPRDAVIQRMMEAHEEVLNRLWETRSSDLPFETRYEAVILASIVEKETALAEERPQVASVFINRLRRGMRLQSDPTIIYGLTGGEPLGRGIRVSELRRNTPYNTYVIKGLPPTPIANPGEASLAAVLNPEQTDFLYFVADGSGGHAFAATLAQHNKNVAHWRCIEEGRSNCQ